MSSAEMAPRTIVFAGGGSGGHLSPGLAVAEALHQLDPSIQALFICSERAIDREVLTGAGVRFETIPAAPFTLRPKGLFRLLRSMPRSIRRSGEVLDQFKAGAVLALGGFVSVPVARAAMRRRTPLALLNLDAVAGRANRLVARWATKLLSVRPAHGLDARRIDFTSVPVRRAARASDSASACRKHLGLDPEKRTLLITGASQGSASLNELVPSIVARHAEHFRGWQVLHLCGRSSPEQVDALRHRYESASLRAIVVPFMHDIGVAWGAASLAITRAGASSVAEVELNHVPAIFVPFPHHRDQHQRLNAEPLVRSGAARLAQDPARPTISDPTLEQALMTLVREPAQLELLARSARARSTDDAAISIAATMLALLSGERSTMRE